MVKTPEEKAAAKAAREQAKAQKAAEAASQASVSGEHQPLSVVSPDGHIAVDASISNPNTVVIPDTEARAKLSVATADKMEAIHKEEKELEGAERRATYGSISSSAPENEPTEFKVTYRDHEGKPVERVYSQETHGRDFKALAAEFKRVNASRIIND